MGDQGVQASTQFRAPGPPQFDPWAILGVFQRRWPLLAATTIGAIVVAGAYTAIETPRYLATASVMFNQRTEAVVKDDPEVLGDLPRESTVVDSQVEFLRARRLAEAVVKRLGLDKNPAFLKEAATGFAPSAAASVATNQVLASVDVLRRGYTAVIDIKYKDKDPALAAEIANAYADSYLDAQVGDKVEATRVANAWLRERIDSLRQEVNDAEQAVATYQSSHGLLVATGSALTEQRVTQLQISENAARADLAEKQARLTTAQRQIAAGRSGEELGEALGSPVIINLRSQLAAAKQKRADLEARYGPKHPEVINSRAQSEQLELQIKAEINRIIGSLQTEASAAQSRLSSLRGSLGGAQGSLAVGKSAQVGLDELERTATAKRTLYESYLARLQQTSAQAGLASPDAIVMARALPPPRPFTPNIPFNLLLGAIGGISLGGALVAALEILSTGIRTGTQVEKSLGEAFVGSIPLLSKKEGPPARTILRKPFSLFAESFRQIRIFTRHAAPADCLVLAITSALPKEGKTVSTVCFARSAAQAGARVLMIDCDLRMRSLSRMMPLNPTVGLLEVLSGSIEPAAAIIQDPEVEGCRFMPLSDRPAPTEDYFGSPAMSRLVDALRPAFDLILFDCPPVLAVSDAAQVCEIADAVLFLVRWKSTPVKAAQFALDNLRAAGARIVGVTLSQVNLRAQTRHGDALSYYRSYAEYHAR